MARILPFRRGEAAGERGGRSDARADALFPSDARPADESLPGGEPDPEAERRRTLRRRAILFALVFVFVLGSAAAAFGSRGWLEVRRARAELNALAADVEAKHEQVVALRKEVDRLKTDPSAIERVAREELGFSAKDEVTILLPPASQRGADGRVWLPPPAPKSTKKTADTPRD